MREDLDRKTKYNIEYAKIYKKRIPLDVQKWYYENVLKPAAEAAGEPINTYIKNAIEMRIAADGFRKAQTE